MLLQLHCESIGVSHPLLHRAAPLLDDGADLLPILLSGDTEANLQTAGAAAAEERAADRAATAAAPHPQHGGALGGADTQADGAGARVLRDDAQQVAAAAHLQPLQTAAWPPAAPEAAAAAVPPREPHHLRPRVVDQRNVEGAVGSAAAAQTVALLGRHVDLLVLRVQQHVLVGFLAASQDLDQLDLLFDGDLLRHSQVLQPGRTPGDDLLLTWRSARGRSVRV